MVDAYPVERPPSDQCGWGTVTPKPSTRTLAPRRMARAKVQEWGPRACLGGGRTLCTACSRGYRCVHKACSTAGAQLCPLESQPP